MLPCIKITYTAYLQLNYVKCIREEGPETVHILSWWPQFKIQEDTSNSLKPYAVVKLVGSVIGMRNITHSARFSITFQ